MKDSKGSGWIVICTRCSFRTTLACVLTKRLSLTGCTVPSTVIPDADGETWQAACTNHANLFQHHRRKLEASW